MSFEDKWQLFVQKLKTPEGKKKLALSIAFIVVLIVLGWVIYARYFQKTISEPKKNTDTVIDVKKGTVEEKEESKLNGLSYVKSKANRHPIAIMIENHPEARPQVGLDKAQVIYEAEAEGGITRFMALYGAEDANKIGPVRSARTYYVDWDYEYDAFYAHVGGNADALSLIKQLGVKDLDQFTYGTQAYWRENENKATEHTMYTDTDKLRNIAKDNGWNTSTSDFSAFKFKNDIAKEQRPEKQIIHVNFSSDLYNVKWEYDRNENMYKRYMAGELHKDRITNEYLKTKNIIVQYVNRSLTTNGNESAWIMETVGEGQAIVFFDGKKIDATWKKPTLNDRTRYYDPAGAEIIFDRGNLWYEILPVNAVVTTE